MATLYATVHNTRTREDVSIWRENGATAPLYILGKRPVLAYWEDRIDVLDWAERTLGWNGRDVLYEDGFTGELLDWNGIIAEWFDEMDNID